MISFNTNSILAVSGIAGCYGWTCGDMHLSRGSTEAVSTPDPAMGEDFKEKSVAVPRKCQGPDKLRCSIRLMDELAPYDIILRGRGAICS
jgi:hypothetical protein